MRSVAYLRKSLREAQTIISACWAWQAANAFGEAPSGAEAALRSQMEQVDQGDNNPYLYALLTLAAAGNDSPIVKLAQQGTSP